MRKRSLPALLVTLVTLVLSATVTAGCAAQDAPTTSRAAAAEQAGGSDGSPHGNSGGHSDGNSAPGMAMDMGSAHKPSQPARMICEGEISDAVKRTFVLADQPDATPSWSKEDRMFGCSYRLPDGALELSVHDSLDASEGQQYYDSLQANLPGATPLRGMENFGFPAFNTASGDVAFLKDGKTLQVDATNLTESALPDGFSRQEAAYSVAAAVIACWNEDE